MTIPVERIPLRRHSVEEGSSKLINQVRVLFLSPPPAPHESFLEFSFSVLLGWVSFSDIYFGKYLKVFLFICEDFSPCWFVIKVSSFIHQPFISLEEFSSWVAAYNLLTTLDLVH